jgi:hypothetical protein
LLVLNRPTNHLVSVFRFILLCFSSDLLVLLFFFGQARFPHSPSFTMPFKPAETIKCKACGKSVYPGDKQVNFDGAYYHQPCSKCKDCNCNVSVTNFAFVDEENGEKTLLCKVHYNARFTAAGGVYAGASKYAKQSERESLSKDSAGRRASTEAVSPVKASSTPSKVDVKMAPASVDETAKAPEIMNRRASLKSTGNSLLSKEIESEAGRTAGNTPGKAAAAAAAPLTAVAEEATVFKVTSESAEAVSEEAAEPVSEEAATEGADGEKAGDCCAEGEKNADCCAEGEKNADCCAGEESCGGCSCKCGGGENCQCGDECACKAKEASE